MLEKFVDICLDEVGYLEKKSNACLDDKTANAGSKNYTKYGAWYGLQAQPWCAMFVSWCADRAGICGDVIPRHASCTAGINWFRSRGLWRERAGYTPKRGDIIYFDTVSTRHVGVVTGCKNGRVYTVEGNTSSSADVEPNGGCVAEKSYDVKNSKIFGYGLPEYGDDDMEYKTFCSFMERYLNEKADEKPDDWSGEARAWAEDKGIITGYGDGRLGYKMPVTREEFVQMQYRMRGEN